MKAQIGDVVKIAIRPEWECEAEIIGYDEDNPYPYVCLVAYNFRYGYSISSAKLYKHRWVNKFPEFKLRQHKYFYIEESEIIQIFPGLKW